MDLLVLARPRVEGELLLPLTLDSLQVKLVQEVDGRLRHLPQSRRRRLRCRGKATAMDRQERLKHEESRSDLDREPFALHGARDELDHAELDCFLCDFRALAKHHADSGEVRRVDGVKNCKSLQHDEAEAADLSVLVLRRLHRRLEHVKGGAKLPRGFVRVQQSRFQLSQLLLRRLERLQQLSLLARHQRLDALHVLEQLHQRLVRQSSARLVLYGCEGMGRMSLSRSLGLLLR
mmetsp:Transcript_21079/g.70224  ORF Transcript_21079/g.70224 Transcript_21079/m.70224 type:complete len:234 (-) Transcript_21079:472-1173(-)